MDLFYRADLFYRTNLFWRTNPTPRADGPILLQYESFFAQAHPFLPAPI